MARVKATKKVTKKGKVVEKDEEEITTEKDLSSIFTSEEKIIDEPLEDEEVLDTESESDDIDLDDDVIDPFGDKWER